MTHRLPIRVYYEDTDAGGIVYYANYLKYAERGRTEFLRALGFENSTLKEREGLIFVVRHLEADYLKPARLDDELLLETAVSEIKNASFSMKQSIFCRNQLIFSMDVILVSVDGAGRPAKLPESLKTALAKKP